MQQYASLVELNAPESWLTIGSFDGVHRGHQEILKNLVSGAHAVGAQAVVLTFYPHPSVVLRGQSGPFYLCTPEDRSQLLGEWGADVVITLPFTRELANASASDFMAGLKQKLHMSRLWVGFNFTLGRNREGDVPTLKRLGDLLGYQLEVIPPVEVDGELVSSSQIRGLLAGGNVSRAAQMLGRLYAVEGKVVPGDARGRQLGIPTANLSLWPEWMLPENGVYAGWALVDGERHATVINIGSRPTFEASPVPIRLEAHLLDFDQDLYNHSVRIEFVERLRNEQRFASVADLLMQIQDDIRSARGILVT
ncbi:MAG: bifunctional riboflavin kinase/FAD synthetase [Anaerolineaceae bacterium]|nr:bifunctional riboflavin kinase/FAD synthetase [Anaerolineaceae bacterium]